MIVANGQFGKPWQAPGGLSSHRCEADQALERPRALTCGTEAGVCRIAQFAQVRTARPDGLHQRLPARCYLEPMVPLSHSKLISYKVCSRSTTYLPGTRPCGREHRGVARSGMGDTAHRPICREMGVQRPGREPPMSQVFPKEHDAILPDAIMRHDRGLAPSLRSPMPSVVSHPLVS